MESELEKIIRKTSAKVSFCKCVECKKQCDHPCLGTPTDIQNLINAGYENRLMPIIWTGAKELGITDKEVPMTVPLQDPITGKCTFFKNGLCELHDKGLKPTEGKLSHHSRKWNPKKSIGWAVAKTWL